MPNAVHPICAQLRSLRVAAGLSMIDASRLTGINCLTLGSYERGERLPPLNKLDVVLSAYGYQLAAVPANEPMVRLTENLARDLRIVADQVEKIRAAKESIRQGADW